MELLFQDSFIQQERLLNQLQYSCTRVNQNFIAGVVYYQKKRSKLWPSYCLVRQISNDDQLRQSLSNNWLIDRLPQYTFLLLLNLLNLGFTLLLKQTLKSLLCNFLNYQVLLLNSNTVLLIQMCANIGSNYLLPGYTLSAVPILPAVLILNWLALTRRPCIGPSICCANLSFL